MGKVTISEGTMTLIEAKQTLDNLTDQVYEFIHNEIESKSDEEMGGVDFYHNLKEIHNDYMNLIDFYLEQSIRNNLNIEETDKDITL